MVYNWACNRAGNRSSQDSQNTGDSPWKEAHRMLEKAEQQQMDYRLEVVAREPVENQVRLAVEREVEEKGVVRLEQGEVRMAAAVEQEVVVMEQAVVEQEVVVMERWWRW